MCNKKKNNNQKNSLKHNKRTKTKEKKKKEKKQKLNKTEKGPVLGGIWMKIIQQRKCTCTENEINYWDLYKWYCSYSPSN